MDAARESHELALLLAGRCRRCAERVPGGTALRGAPCPRCAAPTARTEEDRLAVATLLAARTRVHLDAAIIVVLGATFATSFFPVAASLVLAAGFLWVGAKVVRPALRLLSPRRRVVSAWTIRLAGGAWFAASALVMEVLTLVPAFGSIGKAAISAAQLAIAGVFARGYLASQARREANGLPVRTGEWVAVAGAGLALVLFLALAFLAVAWVLAKIAGLAAALR
ncbi:RING finger protein [Anaeromyxobacter oryzae]|uniref:Uncharacterized protein n=1 Tax=Anaeromyxobacter oryzae TaxID=2918170 RepID=A0ABM7X222_9BACT|nr:hypothetical protein [Anaeromyxobacter oryzae]BDG05846.1 hypothetical protein AMOR_48420 [Anaeromyxobacter oryzae]